MHYDPSRYSAPQETVKRHLVDRWTTESRRSYVKRQEQPTVVVEGRPATAPTPVAPPPPQPAPRTITAMVNEVKDLQPQRSLACDSSSKPLGHVDSSSKPFGHVAAVRPPFHCYHADSANVLPPRPVREETYYQQVAEAHAPPATLPTPVTTNRSVRLSAPLGCAGCRFCHRQSSTQQSVSCAEHAEDVSLRRAALVHKRSHVNKGSSRSKGRHHSNKGTSPHAGESNVATISSTQIQTPAAMIAELNHSWSHLRSTSLILCAFCDRVVNRSCDSEESLQRYLESSCGGCGTPGGLMRLLAEDTRKPHTNRAGLPKPNDPPTVPGASDELRPNSRQSRPHTPMDDFADAIELLPGGVVPMEDRRTALGERIRVGRARVPSPARQAAIDMLAELKDGSVKSARLQKWLQEPQSANDSDKAKLCMTWDA